MASDDDLESLGDFHNLEYVDLSNLTVPPSVIEIVPEPVARENCILPLSVAGRVVRIATCQVDGYDLLQRLVFMLDKDIMPVLADRKQIQAAINRHYGL